MYDNKNRIDLLTSTPLIEKEWWNVAWKRTNGGQWAELDFSTEPCTINTINDSTGLFIETTKGKAEGTLTVTYAKPTGGQFKTIQEWTNTDTSKTNHIFKFIEKYDNIHLESISSNLGKYQETSGDLTINYNQITQSQLLQFEHSQYNIFQLDFTQAYNKFDSVTFSKQGDIVDATFDYGRNAITLPVGSTQSLDPTFGYTGSTATSVVTTSATGSACPSVSAKGASTSVVTTASGTSGTCTIDSYYWDISSIPDDSTITDTVLRYDISSIVTLQNCDYNEINGYPPSATAQNLWDDILNTSGGTNFVNNDSGCTSVGNDKTLDLGTSADSDVTAQLSVNWWSIGVAFDSMVRAVTTNTVTFTNAASVELQITYTAGTAPTRNFVDGGANTGISTNCAARTTLATLNTTFPAGDNIIIAPVQVVSTDAGDETVDVRLYKSTTLLAQHEYNSVPVGTNGEGSGYVLIYEDIGASATPTYTVEVCASATAVDAEAKILAVNGLTNAEFQDGSNNADIDTGTTILSKSTSLPAGNNIIFASLSFNNDAAATETIDQMEITRGSVLAASQYSHVLAASGSSEEFFNNFIIAQDVGAPANPTYDIVAGCTDTGTVAAEAKILIIQPKSFAYVDGSSTAIGTGATQIASLSTSFAAFTDKAIVAANEIDDTDSGTEQINAQQYTLESHTSSPVVESWIQYAIETWNVNGNPSDTYSFGLVSAEAREIANQNIQTRALASATGLNSESKIVAFEIANPESDRFATDTPTISDSATNIASYIRTGTDTPVISDSAQIVQIRQVTDTPTISDQATTQASYIRSVTDTPTISDQATTQANYIRTVTDTPVIAEQTTRVANYIRTRIDTFDPVDSAQASVSREATDTPVIADQATTQASYIRSVTDTPTITDSAQVVQIRQVTDTPTITDQATTLASYIRSVTDTPVISDSAQSGQLREATDTPTILDSATTLASYIRQATDTPTITDSAQASYVRTATDTHTITDNATTLASYIRQATDTPAITDQATTQASYIRTATDTPTIIDSAQISQSRSATDIPAITDNATTLASYIRQATDTPTITDSAQSTQDIVVTDTPAITDQATTQASYIRQATDTPAITDQATTQASYIRQATDTPTITDSAQVVHNKVRTATDVFGFVEDTDVAIGTFTPGGKYIWFTCAPSTNGTQGCVVALLCPTGEYVKGIQNGQIVCEPFP